MKNNITELVFVLDKSGSMSGLEGDTIGGFNAMIERQKKLDGKVYVTTVEFADDMTMIHDRVNIKDIKPMTEEDYQVGGCTALLDTLGKTIRHIVDIHRYVRPEDVPEHTIFVITTDGMENASRHFSADKVRDMIKKEEKKYGWEFLFLAANIDALETAERYGIRRERASNYRASREGTQALYGCVDSAVADIRCNRPLSPNWNKNL